MRMALFTNGPGIGTLASAGLGCVALQLNFGTHARRALTQSSTEPEKFKTTFSYDGWQVDAELAEEYHISSEYPLFVSAILDTMLRKQQVHDGDRSHPFIRKLDALTPTLSYAGWEADARKLEWPEANSRSYDVVSSLWKCSSEEKFDSELEVMRLKQAKHSGDRSHARLVRLDKLKAVVNYDGWQVDAEFAEDIMWSEWSKYPEVVSAILDTMLRKQQVHDGDRSHPFIRKLDALTPTLSYAGWEADARKLEWPVAKSRDSVYTISSHPRGMGMRGHEFDSELESMRRKQVTHVENRKKNYVLGSDRSHANLRRLDDMINRLELNRKKG